MTLYTIGHSTRPIDEFLKILHVHSIQVLIDIRAFPVSRRLPHFNSEALEATLQKENVRYIWMKKLGGRRKKLRDDSPNTALRNESFRNYADYMLTHTFLEVAQQVRELVRQAPTAIMCAEKMFFRCHRMLVSDYFALQGVQVLHIEDAAPPRPHVVTGEAQLVGSQVIYREGLLF